MPEQSGDDAPQPPSVDTPSQPEKVGPMSESDAESEPPAPESPMQHAESAEPAPPAMALVTTGPSKLRRTRLRYAKLRASIVRRGVASDVATPQPRKKRRYKSKRCQVVWPQITLADDGVYEVDVALIDHYTRNINAFIKLGFSKPWEKEETGQQGWYVSGFSCTSPLYAGGLRRGDVLLTVNGKKTRSYVQVYFLYQKLKHNKEFEVELLRKGKAPTTLNYRIVDPTVEIEPERPKKRKRKLKKRQSR